MIVAGNENESIALQVGTTVNTVKTHNTRAFRKIGVSSRVGLVRVAFGEDAV